MHCKIIEGTSSMDQCPISNNNCLNVDLYCFFFHVKCKICNFHSCMVQITLLNSVLYTCTCFIMILSNLAFFSLSPIPMPVFVPKSDQCNFHGYVVQWMSELLCVLSFLVKFMGVNAYNLSVKLYYTFPLGLYMLRGMGKLHREKGIIYFQKTKHCDFWLSNLHGIPK